MKIKTMQAAILVEQKKPLVIEQVELPEKLEVGQVYVNSWFTGSIATPFGGYKQSGFSREKGQEALKSYLQVKNVGIQL